MLRLCTALPLEEAYSYAMGHSPVQGVYSTDDGPLNAVFVLLAGYTHARGKYTLLPARLSILPSYARLTRSFNYLSYPLFRLEATTTRRRVLGGDYVPGGTWATYSAVPTRGGAVDRAPIPSRS